MRKSFAYLAARAVAFYMLFLAFLAAVLTAARERAAVILCFGLSLAIVAFAVPSYAQDPAAVAHGLFGGDAGTWALIYIIVQRLAELVLKLIPADTDSGVAKTIRAILQVVAVYKQAK